MCLLLVMRQWIREEQGEQCKQQTNSYLRIPHAFSESTNIANDQFSYVEQFVIIQLKACNEIRNYS